MRTILKTAETLEAGDVLIFDIVTLRKQGFTLTARPTIENARILLPVVDANGNAHTLVRANGPRFMVKAP